MIALSFFLVYLFSLSSIANALVPLSRSTRDLTKRDVNLVFDAVQDNIEDQDESIMADPRTAFAIEMHGTTSLAIVGYQALGQGNIENHPAFIAFFGRGHRSYNTNVQNVRNMLLRVMSLESPSNGRQVHVVINNHQPSNDEGEGDTHASIEPTDVVTTWAAFWTTLQRFNEVVPLPVLQGVSVAQFDLMLSTATTLLHELMHVSYIAIGTILNLQTTPQEVSGVLNAMNLARTNPEAAIRNPESIMLFCVAMYYNLFPVDENHNPNNPVATHVGPAVYTAFVDWPFGDEIAPTNNTYQTDPLANSSPPSGAEWGSSWSSIHYNPVFGSHS